MKKFIHINNHCGYYSVSLACYAETDNDIEFVTHIRTQAEARIIAATLYQLSGEQFELSEIDLLPF